MKVIIIRLLWVFITISSVLLWYALTLNEITVYRTVVTIVSTMWWLFITYLNFHTDDL
jgi:hypothetical protein